MSETHMNILRRRNAELREEIRRLKNLLIIADDRIRRLTEAQSAEGDK